MLQVVDILKDMKYFAWLKEEGHEYLNIIDANVLIPVLSDLNLKEQIEYYALKHSISHKDATEQIVLNINADYEVANNSWKCNGSVSAITDFTAFEIRHNAEKHGYRCKIDEYIESVGNSSNGLMLYLQTPFYSHDAYKELIEKLPDPVKNYALEYTSTDTRYYDMALYRTANAIKTHAPIMLSIITHDKSLRSFIRKVNNINTRKRTIYAYTPRKFVQNILKRN